MKRALEEMRIAGVSTTIPFARFVMENKTFVEGAFSTKFVGDEFTQDVREALHQKYIDKNVGAFLGVRDFLNRKRDRKLFVGIE